MNDKEDIVYFTDPLLNTISVSLSEAGIGDHPLKHGVPREAIGETIEKPYRIYGHMRFAERCHYVRRNYEGPPDPTPRDPKHKICLVVVEYLGSDTGKVVTAHYTDYLSEKSVNIYDVKYDASRKPKKS